MGLFKRIFGRHKKTEKVKVDPQVLAKEKQTFEDACKVVLNDLDGIKSAGIEPPKAVSNELTKIGKEAKDKGYGWAVVALAVQMDRSKSLLATARALNNHVLPPPGDKKETARFDTLRKAVTDAVTAGDEDKAKEALKAYSDAVRAKLKEKAKKDLKDGKPDLKSMQDLVNTPGGKEELDEIVAKLPPDTPQASLKAAIEARYGIKVKQYEHKKSNIVDTSGLTEVDDKLPDKSLQKIYALFLKVPASHVEKSEKLTDLIRFTGDTGGAAYGGGKFYMYAGRADDPNGTQQKFGAKQLRPSDGKPELLEVDDDAKPANDDQVPYFDFATLHEVGHSVDDKNSFMSKSRMAKPEMGGWIVETIDTVAKAGADSFGVPEAFVKGVLSGTDPAIPAKPAETKKAHENAKAWAIAINQQNLWWNGTESKNRAIGGRVYQRSYDAKWTSYLLAARNKGITGYQFRAPGEWFAELYAAYYSKKLKSNHPAVAWLEELETPAK